MLEINKEMNKEKIRKEVENLAPWVGGPIWLTDDVFTEERINKDPRIKGKINYKIFWYVDAVERALGGLKGKRLLDIGSNCGYVPLEASLRGAKEVVSVEPHPENHKRCSLVYETRGLLNNGITLIKDDMETIDVNSLGKFDAIFFCGTVYHCTYPWEILKKYSKMTDTILVESKAAQPAAINDKYGEYEFNKFHEEFGNPLHRVWEGDVRVPTRRTLYKMMQDVEA